MRTTLTLLLVTILLGASTRCTAEESGKSIFFKSKCAMCHGVDGSGKTVMGEVIKVPDLRSAEVQKKTDADLTGSITKGKDKMPAFEGKLTKAQIAKLIPFIRDLGKKH
jgi:mono/diheme cytochrome c family protein